MRIALAGAGNVSVVHAMASVATGGSIGVVASRSDARARERAEQTGAKVVGIDELPGDVDAVVVCTPVDRHARIAERVLAAGTPVLIEKPIASTLADADALVALEGRVLYGENLAFAPVVRRAIDLAHTIGALQYVEVRTLSQRPSWGEFLDPARGGGVLFDLGAHPIALALLLAGDDEPRRVECTLSSSDDVTVDDHAVATIEFASGLVARIEASWRSPDLAWDLQASSASGVVRADLLPLVDLEHDGEPVALPPERSDIDLRLSRLGFLEEHLELARVIDGGTTAMDARFGRAVLEVICGAYASAGIGGASTPLPFTGPRDRTPHQLWKG